MGIIGFGRLGSTHARNVATSKYTELFAVCDTDRQALELAGTTYQTKIFSDLGEFLNQPLDGVIIASNTPLHLDHIRAVAKAGKHIFTEKPIGLTLEETDKALQEVLDAGVLFQIGFQRRWDPRFLQTKKIIADGQIGRPVLFKTYGRDPNASNPENWGLDKNGGLFLNAAIHDYDAIRFLASSEVNRLSATGAALVYRDLARVKDVDTCTTTLFLGDDMMAMTEWSRYAAYGYDIGLEVIGTEGIVVIGRKRAQVVTVHCRNDNTPTVFNEFADAYAAEIDGFARSIKEGRGTDPGMEDARIALHLALTARKSYEKRGELLDVTTLSPLKKAL